MADKTFRGERVSESWYTVLTEAAKQVDFRLNDGRRTKAKQEALVRQKGVWSSSNPTGAAAYSPNAPHIRVGREDHALDVDTADNGHKKLADWLRRRGLPVNFKIFAEPWHLEVSSEAGLKRLAADLKSPTLRKGVVNREAVRRLQTMLRRWGYRSVIINGKFDALTRIAVRKFQRKHKIPVTADTRVGPSTWEALRR